MNDHPQPSAPVPVPGAPVPEAPAGPPTPHARRRVDVGLLVFLGVLVLALAGSLTTLGVASARAEKPADVARAYLQALADGDAAKALSYTSAVPSDPTLLTDAVLAASEQRAPLTGVAVTQGSDPTDGVDVTYQLGGDTVDDHYDLTRVGRSWKLDQATALVDFQPSLGSAGVPVLVNGVAVTSSTTDAFPVSYAVTTGLPTLDWGEASTTTVSLDQTSTDLDLEPRLTDEGQDQFESGARKLIGACVARHELKPSGCPFGFLQPSSGPRIPDSTVRWSVKGNPWKDLPAAEVEPANGQAAARSHLSMTFVNSCSFSTGEKCKTEEQEREVYFAGDVSADPVTVTLSDY